MSNGVKEIHAKLLGELVVPSSSWSLHPEKKPAFKSKEQVIDFASVNNEPLYIHVPISGGDEDEYVRVIVNSQDEDVVFKITDRDNGGVSKVHGSHIKNLNSTVTELVNESLKEGRQAKTL
jgi:hypothetical protein